MTSSRVVSLLAVGMLVALVGCSVSASSWSLSKSSRSGSRSSDSSSSSSPGAPERAYHDDVADYTRAYARSGSGDPSGFQTDIARLAQEHGITNWEENPTTYTAIGEGLGSAQVSEAELMAYKRNLCGGDASKEAALQSGYDSIR
jgi:hypothetical protein